ncbi:MAG: pilus assembly protein PilP [Pseudomonadota bacterium]
MKTLLNNSLRSHSVVLLLLILSGCGDSAVSDLREFVDTAYQDKKPEIEPLPEQTPFKKHEYSAFELADPFNSNNVAGTQGQDIDATGLRPDPNRSREPLEAFPLDSLRMVGTMSKDETPWVIVQTNQGTAHFLKVGNYMGQNDGRIKEINTEQQKMVLAETFVNANGRWETRDVELALDE